MQDIDLKYMSMVCINKSKHHSKTVRADPVSLTIDLH